MVRDRYAVHSSKELPLFLRPGAASGGQNQQGSVGIAQLGRARQPVRIEGKRDVSSSLLSQGVVVFWLAEEDRRIAAGWGVGGWAPCRRGTP